MARKPFKHYQDPKHYTEFCSGRPGFGRRMTDKLEEVTCKNCLRQLAKIKSA